MNQLVANILQLDLQFIYISGPKLTGQQQQQHTQSYQVTNLLSAPHTHTHTHSGSPPSNLETVVLLQWSPGETLAAPLSAPIVMNKFSAHYSGLDL